MLLCMAVSILSVTPAQAQSNPPSLTPAIQKGVNWLTAQIQTDGNLSAAVTVLSTPLQAQTEAALALHATGTAAPVALLSNIAAADAGGSAEYLSRKISVAATQNNVNPADVAALQGLAVSKSGFASSTALTASTLDTAQALLALAAAGTSDPTTTASALTYLISQQTSSGNFNIYGSQTSLYTTAYAVMAMAAHRATGGIANNLQAAQTWLLAARQSGTYESTLSNSVALLALTKLTSDTSVLNPLVDALTAAQDGGGSWQQDAYLTAMAVRALRAAQTVPAISTASGLHGVVIDNDTLQPVADAVVSLTAAPATSVNTAADGSFSFDNLNAGTVSFSISKLGYASRTISTPVSAGQVTELGSIHLTPALLTAELKGVIKNNSGTVLSGVTVSAGVRSAVSDAQGRYLLTDLSPGPATVLASLYSYADASASLTLEAGVSYNFSPTLYPWSGGTQAISMSGFVVDRDTGTGIAGAAVQLGSQNYSTGSNGSFSFTGLQEGDVSLSVSAANYQSAQVQTHLGKGVNNVGRIPLPKTGATSNPTQISGVVTTTTGAALAGATVSAGSISAITDVQGQYLLTNLTAGNTVLQARRDGYTAASASVTIVAGQSYVFSPVLAATGQTGSGATLTGSVVHSVTKAALLGVNVSITINSTASGTGANTASVTTPVNGSFSLNNLAEGPFTLTLSLDGYQAWKAQGTLVSGLNQAGILELTPLPSSSILQGMVRDAKTQAPLPGATVSIDGMANTATSAADGRYTLGNITRTGLLGVQARSAAYYDQHAQISLAQPGTFDLDFALVPADGNTANGIRFNSAQTNKPSYTANEVVELGVEVQNTQSTAASLLIEADVVDAQNNIVFTFMANAPTGWKGERQANQPKLIAPSSVLVVPMEWFMRNQSAGRYNVHARGVDGSGAVVAQVDTSFVVESAAILGGGLSANPPIAQVGTQLPVKLSANVTNVGNVAIPAGDYDLKITLDSAETLINSDLGVDIRQTTVFNGDAGPLTADTQGNLYAYSRSGSDYRIIKYDSTGAQTVLTTLDGTQLGALGYSVSDMVWSNGLWLSGYYNKLLQLSATGAQQAMVTVSALDTIRSVDVAANGDTYVVGSKSGEERLVRRDSSGVETVLARGGLAGPTGLSKDDSGNYVVANYNDSTLSKVNAQTGEVSPFASDLKSPRGLIRDALGNFYVASNADNSVRKISPSGQVTVYATGLPSPYALAMDAHGVLYVSCQGDHSVQKVLNDGTVQSFAKALAYSPTAIKYDALGTLWILNSGDGSLRKKTQGDAPVEVLATNLGNPTGLELDDQGNAYVVTGSSLTKVAANGSKTILVNTLQSAQGVALDDQGKFWVTESATEPRLRRFDTDGSVMTELQTPFYSPGKIVMNAQGDQFVLNTYHVTRVVNGVAQVFYRDSANGNITDMAVDPTTGDLVVLLNYSKLQRISATGVLLSSQTLSSSVYNIAIDASGSIRTAYYSRQLKTVNADGTVSNWVALPDTQDYCKSLQSANGKLSCPTSNSYKVHLIDADGTARTVDVGTNIYGQSVAADGSVMIAVYNDLRVVDHATGTVSAVFTTKPANTNLYNLAGFNRDAASGLVYLSETSGHHYAAYNAAGQVQANLYGFGPAYDIVRTGTELHFVDNNARLFKLQTNAQYEFVTTVTSGTNRLAYHNGQIFGASYYSLWMWDGLSLVSNWVNLPSGMSSNGGVAAYAGGLAAASSYYHRVMAWSLDKQLLADYAGVIRPTGLAFDTLGNLVVASESTYELAKYQSLGSGTLSGTPLRMAKSSYTPHMLIQGPAGEIWFTQSNYGVTRMLLDGSLNIAAASDSGSLEGLLLDNGQPVVVNAQESELRRYDGTAWHVLAAGMVGAQRVRLSPLGTPLVLSRSNSALLGYTGTSMKTLASNLPASLYTLTLDAQGQAYMGSDTAQLVVLTPDGQVQYPSVASTLGQLVIYGSVYANNRLYVGQQVSSQTRVSELRFSTSAAAPAAGTVVYQGKVPGLALAANGDYQPLDLGQWLPPYGGDFKIEVSHANVAGSASNFLHVGPHAKGQLDAAKSELPPGDQTLNMCVRLNGADFTSLSRVEISQVHPVASTGTPKGLASDRAGKVYFTDASNLYRAEPSGAQVVASGLSLGFGLVADDLGQMLVASRNASSGSYELISISPEGVKTVLADLGVNSANGLQINSVGDVLVGSPNKLLKVNAAHQVSVFTTVGLPNPRGIAIDGKDNVYVQNESQLVTRISPEGAVREIFSGGDGDANPYFEGDGYPNIAADCAENFYIAPYQWKKIGVQSSEEHVLAQVVPRTGKMGILFDTLSVDPRLNDIDYLSYDRLNSRVLAWNDGDGKVWSVPVTCGAIGVKTHLIAKPGQALSNTSLTPAAVINKTDGRTEYVWSLKDVTTTGAKICFDTNQDNLTSGERRSTLDSGFISFQNSFTSGDVTVPLDIPSVSVASAVHISVTTNQPRYTEAEEAVFTAPVRNDDSKPQFAQVRFSVLDAQQRVVATLPLADGITVPAQNTAQVTANWPLNGVLAGSYQVKAELLLTAGVLAEEATAPFEVQASNTNAVIVAHISTDRASYSAAQRPQITSRISNQSVNTLVGELIGTTQVIDAQQHVLITYSETLTQLVQGGIKTYVYNLNPALLASGLLSGNYSAKLSVAAASAPNTVLALHSTNFVVLDTSQTGVGISGTLLASPDTSPLLQTVTLKLNLGNQGNAAVQNSTVHVRVIDPDTGDILGNFTQAGVNLGTGSNASLNFSWPWNANGTAGSTVFAVASIDIAGHEQVLAQAPIRLVAAGAINLSGSVTASPKRVTVGQAVQLNYSVANTSSDTLLLKMRLRVTQLNNLAGAGAAPTNQDWVFNLELAPQGQPTSQHQGQQAWTPPGPRGTRYQVYWEALSVDPKPVGISGKSVKTAQSAIRLASAKTPSRSIKQGAQPGLLGVDLFELADTSTTQPVPLFDHSPAGWAAQLLLITLMLGLARSWQRRGRALRRPLR